MKELRDIFIALKSLPEEANPVLATVVDVEGSSFRLPGAKMLILANGNTIGSVSGGCLEADVLERASEVRDSGQPAMFVYDTTSTDDSVFSLNMGCRGIVRILMEPARNNELIRFYRDNTENARPGVVATRISGGEIGSHVIVDSEGVRHSSFEDPGFTQTVVSRADEILKGGRSELSEIKGEEIFFDYIPVPTKLLIFGAGADAVPLAELAHAVGWKTHVVDHRRSYANAERFPKADMISNPERERLPIVAGEAGNCLAVVMTHNVETDRQVLSELLRSPVEYIGVMGPKSRTESMLGEIGESGVKITGQMRARIHGPVGLDIGATTPEGIALSIVAEMQTFLSGRNGGFLKDRKGSIYDRG